MGRWKWRSGGVLSVAMNVEDEAARISGDLGIWVFRVWEDTMVGPSHTIRPTLVCRRPS